MSVGPGIFVGVGGTDVAVGGISVAVGGMGVLVAVGGTGVFVGTGPVPSVQISKLQPFRLPPSKFALSSMRSVQVPVLFCPSKADNALLGWYVPPPTGGQGQLPAAASSSRFKSKLSLLVQELAMICISVPDGLERLKSKSLM